MYGTCLCIWLGVTPRHLFDARLKEHQITPNPPQVPMQVTPFPPQVLATFWWDFVNACSVLVGLLGNGQGIVWNQVCDFANVKKVDQWGPGVMSCSHMSETSSLVWRYKHIHACMHTCMQTYIHTDRHTYIQTHRCMNVCMHAYIHACMHMYRCTYVHTCT